jgi:hypothetical protein
MLFGFIQQIQAWRKIAGICLHFAQASFRSVQKSAVSMNVEF